MDVDVLNFVISVISNIAWFLSYQPMIYFVGLAFGLGIVRIIKEIINLK